MAMTDQYLVCCDCRSEFVFTSGEAEFFETKGYLPPKRCAPCRRKKRAAYSTDWHSD